MQTFTCPTCGQPLKLMDANSPNAGAYLHVWCYGPPICASPFDIEIMPSPTLEAHTVSFKRVASRMDGARSYMWEHLGVPTP